jgi:hypothetical protein
MSKGIAAIAAAVPFNISGFMKFRFRTERAGNIAGNLAQGTVATLKCP